MRQIWHRASTHLHDSILKNIGHREKQWLGPHGSACFRPGRTLSDSVCDVIICIHSNLNRNISTGKVVPSKANTRGPAERKQTSLSKGMLILSCFSHCQALIHTLAAAVEDEDEELRDKDYRPKRKASSVSEESTGHETDVSIAEVEKPTGSRAKVSHQKKSKVRFKKHSLGPCLTDI